MTTHDQNKKTLRHFQCRDYLWEVFEQMSTELECSTDYLINEAMRQYARSRNYGTSRSMQPREDLRDDQPTNPPLRMHNAHDAEIDDDGDDDGELEDSDAGEDQNAVAGQGRGQAAVASANGIPSLRDSARAAAQPVAPPPPRQRTLTPAARAHGSSPDLAQSGIASLPPMPRRPPAPGSLPPLPPPPPRSRVPTMATAAPTAGSSGASPMSHPSAPPPLPVQNPAAAVSRAPAASARARSLFIIFNGQKIPVNKEEFVIGRGSKSADLAIKDGNISRRHAAVVLHSGTYYLKDLGSTNGVEFQGRRFDSKRIEEGDLFRICDYELRFTYQ